MMKPRLKHLGTGIGHSNKLLAPMVSAAIALIVVTNYCILRLIGSAASPEALFVSVLPIAVPASIAVILVMSVLYHTLQEVLVELSRRQHDLVEKAQLDALTGVASRQLFEERLAQALARYRRSGERFAVIMLDLDHFKRVNDLHGHQTGDNLLKIAAARIASEVRDVDTVARFGGDEFLILQDNVSRLADVRRLCARIRTQLQNWYEIGALQLRLPASLGAVIAHKQLREPSDYVRAADIALYEAKARGRNCFQFFSERLDERLRRRDLLENDLREALKSATEIAVHYQPQIDAGGELSGVEALFRWRHPRLGNIPATEAIEIAEEAALIDILGEFVFRQAAAFARAYPELSVAVNLSPAQFARSGGISSRLYDLAREEQVPPAQIELEITERLFMQVGSGSDSEIQNLRNFGFRVALDDFGTGYSSLSYLRRFRVDRLKLDKSFAAETDVQHNIAVLRAAVSLAHLLKLEVIAEGIESELQESIALESGCDVLQGHRFGAPMTKVEFDAYWDARQRAAA